MKLKAFRNIFCNFLIFVALCFIILYGFSDDYAVAKLPASAQPIYSCENANNEISLMVNVYWGTEYIGEMLDIFDEYGVKTTFFVGGTWVNQEGAVLKEIFDRGHEIGNHGYFHKDMAKISYEKNVEEIVNCDKMVYAVCGVVPKLFAPPSGSFSKDTLLAAENNDKLVIMWSKDTVDWRDKDANIIFTRATKNIKSGDLILMHPTKETVKALKDILSFYEQNNIKVTKVSNVIAENIGE